ARADETGDSESQLEALSTGSEIEIAFNVKFLIDVLSVIDVPQTALETTASKSPGVIKPVGDDSFLHVIMPMHPTR
ncbi:MAG: DNA polymerase III subunit beta, partial [Chloroflexi bacterium]|nr:DNA polymerase III subunit beta [Chloroflexota bacterium]